MKLSDHFKITKLSEIRHILGLVVTQNQFEKSIHISQMAYIHKILTFFGMEDATPVVMSLIVKYKLSAAQSLVIHDEKSKYQNYASNLYYLSIIGSLLFATQS